MSGLKLKLNLNTGGLPKASSPATPSAATPGGSRPTPKLKLTNKSTPSTPAPVVEDALKPKKSKAGRATKPSAKVLDSRKRVKEESDSDDDGSTIAVQPATKRPKIKMMVPGKQPPPKTPVGQTPILAIKAKIKGKPPKRQPGEGYDSEASDRETDPMIEEEFVLRMMPGEDCDYLRQAIVEKKIGLSPSMGGANIHMKFFAPDGRRAAITIRGHPYAAVLVDLPCIIEGMKSWDKRGWWKSADICQMLWVFSPIQKEEDAKTIALPKIVDGETYQYPHGLTPPMHFARKRRFRKRISRTAIEAIESAVQRLLDADSKAKSTRWEMVDPEAESRQASQAYSPGPGGSPGYNAGQDEYSEDEDAEGEADDMGGYFGNNHGQAIIEGDLGDLDADLEADLEAAMQAEEFEAATPMSTLGGATPFTTTGETPAATMAPEEDSGDESMEGEDDDDDEDDEAGEIDEDEKARIAQLQGLREDIAELEKQIQSVQAQQAAQANPILKKRLDENVRKLKAELQLKKSSLGEGDDD
ncbi:hypothetical protein G7Y89_g11793 [Cudoniella acicularis]|uniref:TAFII55 protein conserved region domain-containing protein n=1 Tax=Cudoniella acicularis TaxID=354080 RepID=A0A8H4VXZ7_9HELO|nr:hypothetical protein G7Y89_g11793 [Cudoniella acicularis]